MEVGLHLRFIHGTPAFGIYKVKSDLLRRYRTNTSDALPSYLQKVRSELHSNRKGLLNGPPGYLNEVSYTLHRMERVNTVHTPVPAVLDDRLATRVGELPDRSYFQLKVKGRKLRTYIVRNNLFI